MHLKYRDGTAGDKMDSVVYVVGNKFEKFAAGQCLTFSSFQSLPLDVLSKIKKLVLGQGLGRPEWEAIERTIREAHLHHEIEVEEYISRKIGASVVHKKQDENVMISLPQQLDDGSFVTHLIVDEKCAELSDHVTGIHMQGILFVEAARQAMYACVADRVARNAGFVPERSGYILNDIQIIYRRFLYPLPIRIKVRAHGERVLKRAGTFVCDSNVQFDQEGVGVGVEVLCRATMLDEKIVAQQELRGAHKLLKTVI
jgi:hypothetical protein